MTALRAAAFIGGVAVAMAVLVSAVRTVVVPRSETTLITRVVFGVVRKIFWLVAHERRAFEDRDRWLARYAPMSLVLLPFAWAAAMTAAFAAIYWSFDVPPDDALVLSGSSLTTLGFERDARTRTDLTSAVEALIGLILVALLISYLPTIYSRFAARERPLIRLSLLAGMPPDPATLLIRVADADAFDVLDDQWNEWADWFAEVRESHTSFPSLAFFRSQDPRLNWVTASGTVLDSAALVLAALDEPSPSAPLMLRTGFETMRRVATNYGFAVDHQPRPDDRISVPREQLLEIVHELRAAGLAVKRDDDAIWRDWAGWRVNYDSALVGLAGLVVVPRTRLLIAADELAG